MAKKPLFQAIGQQNKRKENASKKYLGQYAHQIQNETIKNQKEDAPYYYRYTPETQSFKQENKGTISNDNPFGGLSVGAYVNEDNSVVIGGFTFSNADYVDGKKQGFIKTDSDGIDKLTDIAWAKSKSIPIEKKTVSPRLKNEVNVRASDVENVVAKSLFPYYEKYGDGERYRGAVYGVMMDFDGNKAYQSVLKDEYMKSILREATETPTHDFLTSVERTANQIPWLYDELDGKAETIVSDSTGEKKQVETVKTPFRQALESIVYNGDGSYKEALRKYALDSYEAKSKGEANKLIDKANSLVGSINYYNKAKYTYGDGDNDFIEDENNVFEDMWELLSTGSTQQGKRNEQYDPLIDKAKQELANIKEILKRVYGKTINLPEEIEDDLPGASREADLEIRQMVANQTAMKAYSDPNFKEKVAGDIIDTEMLSFPEVDKSKILANSEEDKDGMIALLNIGRFAQYGHSGMARDFASADVLGLDDQPSYVAVKNATDEEAKVFAYLFNTSKTSAALYYYNMLPVWTERKDAADARNDYEIMQKMEDGEWYEQALSAILQTGTALDSGVHSVGRGLQGVWDALPFTEGSKYYAPTVAQRTAALNKEDASTLGGIALGAVETAPQVAGTIGVSYLTTPVGGQLFSSSIAGGNAYAQAKNMGKSEAQAVGFGIAVGTLEYITEKYIGSTIQGFGTSASTKVGSAISKTKIGQKVSDAMIELGKKHPKTQAIINTTSRWFGSGASESLEEYVTKVSTPMLENLILEENNKFSLAPEGAFEESATGFLVGMVLGGSRVAGTYNQILRGNTIAIDVANMSDKQVVDYYVSQYSDDMIGSMIAMKENGFYALSADEQAKKIEAKRKELLKSDPEQIRNMLIAESKAQAGIIRMYDYAKQGLSYEEALNKTKKSGADTSGMDVFLKQAYQMGKDSVDKTTTRLDERAKYTGGAYAEINSLIQNNEATSYIADRIMEIDNTVSREEAIRTVNKAKNEAFAKSITGLTDVERANAIKERASLEKAAEQRYQKMEFEKTLSEAENKLGASGISFSSSFAIDAVSSISGNVASKLNSELSTKVSSDKLYNAVLEGIVAQGDVDAEQLTKKLADVYASSILVSSADYKNITSAGISVTEALTNYVRDGKIPEGIKNKPSFEAIASRFKTVSDSLVSQVTNARTRLFGSSTLAVKPTNVEAQNTTPAVKETEAKVEEKNAVSEKKTSKSIKTLEQDLILNDVADEVRERIIEKVRRAEKSVIERGATIKKAIDSAKQLSSDIANDVSEMTEQKVSKWDFFEGSFVGVVADSNENALKESEILYRQSFDSAGLSNEQSNEILNNIEADILGIRTQLFGENANAYEGEVYSEETKMTTEPTQEETDENVNEPDNSKKTVNAEVETDTTDEAVMELAKTITDEKPIDDSVIDYTNSNAEGKVNWNDLSKSQQRAINLVKAVANKFGIKLKLIANGVSLGINGVYVSESNAIILDIYAGINNFGNIGSTVVQTMSHEMTHWMKAKATALYNKIDELVFKALEKNGGMSRTDRINDEMNKLGTKNFEEARDEIIARACEDMLAKSEFGQSLYNELTTPEKKTFRQAVKEAFTKTRSKVQSILSEYKSNSKEASILRELDTELGEISKVWSEAISQISSETDASRETDVKENTADEDSVKFASRSDASAEPERKETIDYIRSLGRISVNDFSSENIKRLEKFAKRYKDMGIKSPFFRAWFGDWRANDKSRIDFVEVNSDFIERSDIPTGDFYNNDTEWTITTNADGKDETAHKSGKWSANYKALKDVEKMLKNAILLDTVTISLPSRKLGNSAIFMHHLYCPVKLKDVGHRGVAKLYVAETFEGSKKFYLNKIEMSPDTMVSTNDGSTRSNSSISDDTISVADIFDFVKKHDVYYEKDSKNPVYFNPKPSSVVVDENGRPKKVYHSTSEKFDAFDITKSRSWDGTPDYDLPGFYFSENYEDSAAYGGNVGEYYIKITKPYEGDVYSLRKEKGTYRAAYDYLVSQGYDGVIIDEFGEGDYEYIVLKDINIKSATQNIGTYDGEDSNTRFSKRDNTGRTLSEEQQDYFKDSKVRRNKRPDIDNKNVVFADKVGASAEMERAFKPSSSIVLNFANAIDKWISGNMTSSEYFELGETPTVLKELGAKDLPVIMSQDVIVKITGEKHSISLDEIKKLPEAIHDPIMVFSSATVPNAFVLITELSDKGGNSVIAALHLNRGDKHFRVNRVSSVYGKNNIANFIETQSELGNLRYIDKEKNHPWSQSRGLQLPKLADTISDSTNNILQKEDIVNSILSKNEDNDTRYSRRTTPEQDADYMKAVESGDMDMEQRMVDEAAEKAFPNSKVRDNNGKVVQVYHGTSKGGYTVFDTYAYHSKFGLFGNGAYFTEDRSIAEQYTNKGRGDKPQVYNAYLNITNPIDMDAKADISLWNKALERADLDYITLSEGMTNEGAFREVTETLADEGYVSYEAEEVVRNIFENMGYDGITHIGGGRANKSDGAKHRVWIAFESEQIKSADPVTYDDDGNVIPLSERFDAEKNDIRYSQRRKKVTTEDIEKFDCLQYNEIKLPYAEQEKVQSEFLTWHADKRNQLITQTLSNGITYRCMIDDDGIVHIYGRKTSENIHEEWGESYDNGDTEKLDTIAEELRSGSRNDNSSSKLSRDGRESRRDDTSDNYFVSGERRSNRTGYSKNRNDTNRKPKEYKFNEDGTGEVTYDDGTTTKFSKRNPSKEINIGDYTLDELVNLPDDKFNALYEALGLDAWFEQNDELLDDEDISIDDISEELHVEPEKVEILIRREGLGNSYIEDGSMAVMTADRIDRDIADSGAKFNPGYAQKYITRIAPSDFIDLTVSQANIDRDNFDTKVEGDAGSKMADVDYASALKNSKQTPYLVIDKATGRIVGHNGRHRMRALEMAGIESAEIEVQFVDEDGGIIKNNSETIPVMSISSQFDTAIETRIRNIIPMNEAHRGEIEGFYGETVHEGAGVRYSLRDNSYTEEQLNDIVDDFSIIKEPETPKIQYSLDRDSGVTDEELGRMDELFENSRVASAVTKEKGFTNKLKALKIGFGDKAKYVFNSITRVFPEISERGEKGTYYAEARKTFLQWKKIPDLSSFMSQKNLTDMTKGLSKEEFDIFSQLVYYRDLREEAKLQEDNGYTEIRLPGNVSPDAVNRKIADLEAKASDKVFKAIDDRKAIWNDLKKAYIAANKKLGFDVSDRFNREDYFHHEVLDKMLEKGRGTGKRDMEIKTFRSWLKKRNGSDLAINTDFLSVEYKSLIQMHYDTYVAEYLCKIKDKYDVKSSFEAEAKISNKAIFDNLVYKQRNDSLKSAVAELSNYLKEGGKVLKKDNEFLYAYSVLESLENEGKIPPLHLELLTDPKESKLVIDSLEPLAKTPIDSRMHPDTKALHRNAKIIYQHCTASEAETKQKWFNSRIMFGFNGLFESAEEGILPDFNGRYTEVVESLKNRSLDSPELYRYISELSGVEILEDASEEIESAIKSARTVMKYTSQKKAWFKETLGDDYQTWETVAKQRSNEYSIFQPRKGNYFFSKEVMAEEVFNDAFNEVINRLCDGERGVAEVAENQTELFKRYAETIRIMGNPYQQWVLPTELVKTMEAVGNPKPEALFLKGMRNVLRAWKGWATSINPFRTIKFFIRNLTGDLDVVVAGDPRILKETPKAIREIYAAMHDKTYSADFMEWVERGGYSSMLFANEMDSEMQEKLFRELVNKDGTLKGMKAVDKSKLIATSVLKAPFRAWTKYNDAVENLHNFREAILRYSSYLYYKDYIDARTEKGKSVSNVTSNRFIVKGLESLEDKAYQLSKDLLGAYDEVGQMGQALRRYAVPFYSFTETNAKRYYRMFANIIASDASIPEKAGKVLLKGVMVNWMSILIALWNNLMWDEEEEALPKSVKEVPHVILGRVGDKVITFNRLGSFNELLEWFGLEDYKWTTDDLMAPVDKIWGSITPIVKVPFEAVTGINYYPSVSKPSTIRDTGRYIANSFGVPEIYDIATGKPSKGWQDVLLGSVVYDYDYKESAYWEVADLKNEFSGKNGDGATYPTNDKSNAIYYMKQAIRYKDEEAAIKYMNEYFENGGTGKDLIQSFQRLDPFYGMLNDIEKQEKFIASLNDKEKEKLELAIQYYKDNLELPYNVKEYLKKKGITDEQARSVLTTYIKSIVNGSNSQDKYYDPNIPPIYDEFGRPDTMWRMTDDERSKAGLYTDAQYEVVDTELDRLKKALKNDNMYPPEQREYYTEDDVKYEMTEEELVEAQKIRGQKSMELVYKLINDKTYYKGKKYSKMTDEEKVKALKDCYSDAGDYTKKKMLNKVKESE